MAARCRAFNPIHCNTTEPPSRSSSPSPSSFFWFLTARGELERRCSVFLFSFLVSHISLPWFFLFFSLVGDLDSPGLVLMWAAVSTVTDARDKACAPAFGQGHQRIVDSSALFTQSLFLSLSLSFFILYSASFCLPLSTSSHSNCDFLFLPRFAPHGVVFPPESGKHVFF